MATHTNPNKPSAERAAIRKRVDELPILAYSKELRHEAADQIAWVRSTPSFKSCFKKWSLNEQNTVQGKNGTPSSNLGWWRVGGGQVFWKSQVLPPMLGSLHHQAPAKRRTIRILGN